MQMASAPAAPNSLLPDALLVYRIAAMSDRSALADLDARHGMTLYALAYSRLLDVEAADAAVAAAFREVWRSAASFDPHTTTAARWLADLTRRAVQQRLRGLVVPGRRPPSLRREVPASQLLSAAGASAPRPRPAAPLARVAARLLLSL